MGPYSTLVYRQSWKIVFCYKNKTKIMIRWLQHFGASLIFLITHFLKTLELLICSKAIYILNWSTSMCLSGEVV